MTKAGKSEKADDKAAKKAAKQAAKATKKTKRAGEDLAALAAAVSAEAAAAARTMPVKNALLEAGRVLAAAKRARKVLEGLPTFDVATIDHLKGRIDLVESTEKAWNAARFAKAERKLGDARKEGEAVRADIMRAARFVTRHDADAQDELDHIDEGEGLADLVADLADLASFVEARAELFANLPGFDAGAAAEARRLAAELTAGVDNEEAAAALDARNRALVLLEAAVAEIRAAAAFVFRNKPAKAAEFASRYHAERMIRRRAKAPKPAPKPPAPAPAAG